MTLAQPTPYTKGYDFTDYAEDHTSAPFNASELDSELDDIETTLDGLCDNIALIQRDDGRIANGVVTPDSLSTATLAMIGAGNTGQLNWTPRGNWATSTDYAIGDVVQNAAGGITTAYVCATAHTSGTLSTDVTAGKFVTLGATTNGVASSISFSATGTIAATDVQAAVAEVALEALQVANNLSDVASAATSRTNLVVASKAELQQQTHTHAAAGGSADAITASYTPAVTALVNRMRLAFVAAAANTTAAPTFTPNDGVVAAVGMVKGANTALAAGDIAGQYAVCIVEYNSTLLKWVLLNPALPPGSLPSIGGTMTGDLVMSGACVEEAHGTDIASAATIDLETATGNVVDVTGTTGITAITLSNGHERTVRFTGSLLLTHASNLVLPDSANIQTAAGDYAVFRGYASAVVRCTHYSRLARHGSDVASATTTVLDTTTGDLVDVTGTTTITGITLAEGRERTVRFTGALTLTHGASLVLPGGANIATAAGDFAIFRGYAAGVVRCILFQRADGATVNAPIATCEGRLTLESGVAVSTSDQTAKETLYFTPYKGNRIALYDGARWNLRAFAELSIDIPDATNCYDVFAYDNSGVAALELLAWTNETTRATALTKQDGVLSLTGALTRRYLGTFYSTTAGNGQVEDSKAKRNLYNYYNKVVRSLSAIDTTDSWTYTTNTLRQVRATATNQLEFVVGVSEDMVEALAVACCSNGSVVNVELGIGLDSTSALAADQVNQLGVTNTACTLSATYRGFPGVGRHLLVPLEASSASGTTTWLGDNGGALVQTGIKGSILA